MVFPAVRPLRVHWPLPDPAGVRGSDEEVLHAFRSARDELRTRLSVLFRDGYPASGGSGW